MREPAVNRTPLAVMVGLVVVMVIGAVAADSLKGKKTSTEPPVPVDNARAVLLPAGDGVDRRVVVPPCRTPPETTANDLAAGRPVPNAAVFRLSGSGEAQAVLVPDCIRGSTAVTAGGDLPAAAFVLPVGVRAATNPTLQIAAQSQIIVPAGSGARTVVVPPCTGARPRPSGTPTTPAAAGVPGSDVVLDPSGETDVVTAPSC
ncbi:MAG: hypothetical protein M3459_13280 [Actinomycetota bacterium]|nr:hypothetical protein [Actinomycetota bacterium]